MKHIEKTVFISYRRTDAEWALKIYKWLREHDYDVFIDVEDIGPGDFERVIVENIRSRRHFLVVLSPTALDSANRTVDWVRREIEEALAVRPKVNIVTVMIDAFDIGNPSVQSRLTGDLVILPKYNSQQITRELFSSQMRHLSEKFLDIDVDDVLHPLTEYAARVAKEQQAAANKAIALKLSNRALDGADYYAARMAIGDYVEKRLDWAIIQDARIQRREGKWDPFETQQTLEEFTNDLATEEGARALCEIGYSYVVAAMDSWCCSQDGLCSKFNEVDLCDKSLEYLHKWKATVSGHEGHEYIMYVHLVRHVIQPDADAGQVHRSAAILLECLKEKGGEVPLETNMVLWLYALVSKDHAAGNGWMQKAWDAFKGPDARIGWCPQTFASAMLFRSWTLARADAHVARHLFEAARTAIKGPIRYREVEFWMHAALRAFPNLE